MNDNHVILWFQYLTTVIPFHTNQGPPCTEQLLIYIKSKSCVCSFYVPCTLIVALSNATNMNEVPYYFCLEYIMDSVLAYGYKMVYDCLK